jgi:hypothetical protein
MPLKSIQSPFFILALAPHPSLAAAPQPVTSHYHRDHAQVLSYDETQATGRDRR